MGENIQDLQKVSNALKITGLTAQLLQLTLFELFLHNVQSHGFLCFTFITTFKINRSSVLTTILQRCLCLHIPSTPPQILLFLLESDKLSRPASYYFHLTPFISPLLLLSSTFTESKGGKLTRQCLKVKKTVVIYFNTD